MAEALAKAVVPEVVTSTIEKDPDKSSAATNNPTTRSEIDTATARRLNRKLDLRVLPPLVVLWFWSFIDRVNIGNARIQGLEKDLRMKGDDFNVALVIFFVPFILFEVPSNLMLRKLAPSTWLTLEVFLLAIFTIGQGVVTSGRGLIAMRFMIGLFEAGLVPGSVYLLSSYYPRFDLQWRLNILMLGNALASAFGGLLAFAVASLNGKHGYRGWRWIFIIEGAITAGLAVIAKFFVVDWPNDAKWLTDEERAIIASRIANDAGTCKMNRLDGKAMKRCFLDWKVWINICIYIGTVTSTYSINLFSPTIIQQLNPTYSPRHVQALVIPIFVVSTATALLSAIASDHFRHRYGFAMVGYLITAVGFALLFAQKHVAVGVRYAALYLVSGGSYISLPLLWTMMVNNVSGQYKTSIASAAQIGLGQCGGIVASLIYTKQQAPYYWTGYRVAFGLLLFASVAMTAYVLGLRYENKLRDSGGRDYRYQLPVEEVDNLGDDHPEFRFVY